MTRGTVLFHKKFIFSDGIEGEKLLVVLNTPSSHDEPYLVCKTTSKCKFYITKEGCHSDKSIYHIKANRDGFLCDTWVQLDELFEFTQEELLNLILKDKICEIKHNLSENTIRAILNCIWKGDDASQYQLDLLFKK